MIGQFYSHFQRVDHRSLSTERTFGDMFSKPYLFVLWNCVDREDARIHVFVPVALCDSEMAQCLLVPTYRIPSITGEMVDSGMTAFNATTSETGVC